MIDFLIESAVMALVPAGQIALLVIVGYVLRIDKRNGGSQCD